MKFCSHCGKQISEYSVSCYNCGYRVNAPKRKNYNYDLPKIGWGALSAFLLGIIGLVIGLVVYPSGTEARKTFLTGWITTFISLTVIYTIISIIMYLKFINHVI